MNNEYSITHDVNQLLRCIFIHQINWEDVSVYIWVIRRKITGKWRDDQREADEE